MRRTLVLVALLIACSDSSGPGDGGVDLVVGEWCTATQQTKALADGDDWIVDLYHNTTTYRNVTGNDGIVREQEVRGCQQAHCTLRGGVGLMTADQAIAYCRDLTL